MSEILSTKENDHEGVKVYSHASVEANILSMIEGNGLIDHKVHYRQLQLKPLFFGKNMTVKPTKGEKHREKVPFDSVGKN